MRVQVFKAMGEFEIDAMETKLNSWLIELSNKGWKVCHTNMTSYQSTDPITYLPSPCLVVTVWFDYAEQSN